MFNPFRLPPKPFSLPMRDFCDDPSDTYCWEHYEEETKAKYPFRYWLNEELPFWFSTRVIRYIKDAHYYLVSHLIPSRQYHFLDLRQPKSLPVPYRYGWIDSDTQILYACFNILCNYVEKELLPGPVQHEFTEEELNDPEWGEQNRAWKEEYDEIKDIYRWWKFERPLEQKRCSDALTAWYDEHKANRNSKEQQQLHSEMKSLDAEFEAKEEEMLIRLIKIRKRMWT